MKIKLENDKKTKKLNILQALKRILLDEDNGIDEIPGLEKIRDQAASEEEKALIDELMKSQSKIDNKFKSSLKVKPSKIKNSNKLKEEPIKGKEIVD